MGHFTIWDRKTFQIYFLKSEYLILSSLNQVKLCVLTTRSAKNKSPSKTNLNHNGQKVFHKNGFEFSPCLHIAWLDVDPILEIFTLATHLKRQFTWGILYRDHYFLFIREFYRVMQNRIQKFDFQEVPYCISTLIKMSQRCRCIECSL